MTERPYKPIAFANEFIFRAKANGVSHMKVQKLVYCSYGWWLAYHDESILDEDPQVWRHGPVFKSLYFVLRPFGWRAITTLQNDNFTSPVPRVSDDDLEVCNLIDWVWGRYGHRSADDLSRMTHEPGSPWDQTVRQFGGKIQRDTYISRDIVKKHFRGLVREYGLTDRPA